MLLKKSSISPLICRATFSRWSSVTVLKTPAATLIVSRTNSNISRCSFSSRASRWSPSSIRRTVSLRTE
ncbi:MAG: hypothetical protein CMJ85_12935 [Planctomycetes bacterium]|nr:hypothetical protein [Planctomycetota bacterium]